MDSALSAQSEQDRRVREKLARELGADIQRLLGEPDVTEIVLNPDGRMWIERFGQPMECIGVMTRANAESIMSTIASIHKTTITRERPILECELPFDGSRFEGLIPPIVAGPCFAIRRKALRVFTLDDYVASGTMTEGQRVRICAAIDAKKNIVVCGGTSSGKTTLLNALIHYVSEAHPYERLILIEDTGELQCSSKNFVTMRSTTDVDMRRLLKVTMRMRPDRIWLGEVRDQEAMTLIDAWNTGHPGGGCSVHANNAESALVRIGSLVRRVVKGPLPHEEIAQAVNVVVSIAKTAEGRRVQEVLAVNGHDGTKYLTSTTEE